MSFFSIKTVAQKQQNHIHKPLVGTVYLSENIIEPRKKLFKSVSLETNRSTVLKCLWRVDWQVLGNKCLDNKPVKGHFFLCHRSLLVIHCELAAVRSLSRSQGKCYTSFTRPSFPCNSHFDWQVLCFAVDIGLGSGGVLIGRCMGFGMKFACVRCQVTGEMAVIGSFTEWCDSRCHCHSPHHRLRSRSHHRRRHCRRPFGAPPP